MLPQTSIRSSDECSRRSESLSSPLLPDDYLELVNPLWSTRELRGRIERVEHETETAATILIKPGYRWPGHKPGQYVRIGIDIDGVRHWRAYSLTSDPYREDGLISITPKKVDEGKVSPYLVEEAKPGTIVSLSNIEGEFVLPDPPPPKLLFISAGSGVTPIMSMLRHLDHYDQLNDAVLLHSARHTDDVIFGDDLRGLADRRDGFRLHEQLTRENGRMGPHDLDRLCPDWRERETYISGPNDMLDAFTEHFERESDCDRLHMERFQPKLGPGGERRRRGRCDQVPGLRVRGRVRRQDADPRRRRGEGPRPAIRLPRGHLPHVRGRAALRPGARPAQRRGLRPGGRGHPDLHQRARRPDRNRPVTRKPPRGIDRHMANATHNGHLTNGHVTIDDEPENPLHRLTPEQIEAIGREFDELHEQVKDSLGDRDARYIRSIIALQRRLALLGRLELVASRWRIPWILGASTLGLAKILENMEIGHNVLHGQWDWMNDPVINSRAWDWDTASTSDAWRHSHNYIHHTFTNILGKDRDLGYEIMRIDPHQKWHPVYLLQPFYNVLLAMLFEWGVAVHDLDFEAIRKGEKDMEQVRKELKGIAGKARTQIQKDYIAWPLISGIVMTLAELAYFSRPRRARAPAEQPAVGLLRLEEAALGAREAARQRVEAAG